MNHEVELEKFITHESIAYILKLIISDMSDKSDLQKQEVLKYYETKIIDVRLIINNYFSLNPSNLWQEIKENFFKYEASNAISKNFFVKLLQLLGFSSYFIEKIKLSYIKRKQDFLREILVLLKNFPFRKNIDEIFNHNFDPETLVNHLINLVLGHLKKTNNILLASKLAESLIQNDHWQEALIILESGRKFLIEEKKYKEAALLIASISNSLKSKENKIGSNYFAGVIDELISKNEFSESNQLIQAMIDTGCLDIAMSGYELFVAKKGSLDAQKILSALVLSNSIGHFLTGIESLINAGHLEEAIRITDQVISTLTSQGQGVKANSIKNEVTKMQENCKIMNLAQTFSQETHIKIDKIEKAEKNKGPEVGILGQSIIPIDFKKDQSQWIRKKE